jgi:hypothetical protein
MKAIRETLVLAKMPSAGLGNKLFCFAHAIIFAEKNKLNFYFTGLSKIHLGPYLRREKSKRYYKHLFKKNYKLNILQLIFKKQIVIDYDLCETQKYIFFKNTIYVFEQVPPWQDFFKHIRENRALVLTRFFEAIHPDILSKLSQKKPPVIGVHIRMGDFRKLNPEEDFEKVGAVRTPLEYFIKLINKIREIGKANFEVQIFTDGKPEDIADIMNLPNIYLAEDDLDFLQMLHLSKSKIIILSAGSTFGQWAAYFSNAAIINHYQHFHSFIRDCDTNKKYFEGICMPEKLPELLINNIMQIK